VFRWRADEPGLTRAFTDVGAGNLATHVGDDPQEVATRRAAVAAGLGLAPERLVFMNQCHGAVVHVVDGPWPGPQVPPGDALVTAVPDLALAVLVADCVPVLLADRGAGVLGAVHAGRPGLAAGVVPATLSAMRELGAREVEAVVGPAVCGRCYEVPEELRAQVAAVAPVSATVSWTGTAALDVASGVVAQLRAGGAQVAWLPGCTREDASLYSYRRAQDCGRFAGIVVRYAGWDR
jgi:YfiH family protein